MKLATINIFFDTPLTHIGIHIKVNEEDMYMDIIELEFKPVTEEMLSKYLNLHELIKALDKDKDAIRKAVLYSHPAGGRVGKYRINVKVENGRRSFKYDDAKALVTEDSWKQLYVPFIEVGDPVKKLAIELIKK